MGIRGQTRGRGPARGRGRARARPAPTDGPGRPTLFPGKYRGNSEVIGHKVTAVLSQTGHDAALMVQEALSAQERRAVSLSDAVEYCIRKATDTPMTA